MRRVTMWEAIRHGVARSLDLFGTMPPLYPVDLHRTDAEALASDWEAVGGDLRRAMDSMAPPSAGASRKADTE